MSRTRNHNVHRYTGHKMLLAEKASRKVEPMPQVLASWTPPPQDDE